MLKPNKQVETGGARLATAPTPVLLPEPKSPKVVRLCLRQDRHFVALAREARYHVNEFAQLCHAVPRELRRQFQTCFHKSPREWLDELQITDAAALLLAGCNLKVVVRLVGLNHVPYFCSKFQKYYGISPMDFVRNFKAHYTIQ